MRCREAYKWQEHKCKAACLILGFYNHRRFNQSSGQHNTFMQHDLLIIGAGPAGLSTALHLARQAPQLIPRILVLEKARHPRPKLCAGGLVADAEILLKGLGLDVREIPHVDASAAHFNFSGRGLTVSLPGRHTLRVVRRNEFDAWLATKARAAGIQIKEDITVKEVRPDADGVTVSTDQGELRARVVAGADGSNGVTRRSVLPRAPVHTARALEVITPVHGVIASDPAHVEEEHGNLPPGNRKLLRRYAPRNDNQRREGVAVFDFFPVPAHIAGYTWDFPTQINGQPMRCWGIYDSNLLAGKTRPPLQSALAAEMQRRGYSLEQFELQGHPIRWYDPGNPLAAPRVLLVGDAAGADPLFGEGISLALGYGKLAAEELESAFQVGEFSFQGYDRRVRRSALGQTLLARWIIAKIVYRLHWTWFQRWFWRYWKPLIVPVAWLFVLNWGRRLK